MNKLNFMLKNLFAEIGKYFPISIILCSMLLLGGNCFAGNARVDIEFKGKKILKYSEICAGKGGPYTGLIFDYGQLECKPNFKEYGGVPISAEMKDSCDSKIQYDPSSGTVVDINIKYAEESFERVLAVLSEKYGKPKEVKVSTFADERLNVLYQWEDSKEGYISLTKDSVVDFKSKSLAPKVLRYCTSLRIRTNEMNRLFSIMEDKSESSRKSRIKNDAAKL